MDQASQIKFSTDANESIKRQLQVEAASEKNQEEIDDYYSIDIIVNFIVQNRYLKVALQFPDHLLGDSVAVAAELKAKCGQDVAIFVLADTSYGSCCVDEVAAAHGDANCIIHFGSACLSLNCRLPVLYVFGKQPIDVDQCYQSFVSLLPDPDTSIILLYDVIYYHALNSIQERLGQHYSKIICSTLKVGKLCSIAESSAIDRRKNEQEIEDTQPSGRTFKLDAKRKIDDHVIFYIGHEGLTLTNLLMSYNTCQFYTYNPELNNGRLESISINKALMRRYYLIQRAKEARVVGIVIGTLGVADYLKILERLKLVLKSAGKKTYTFAVGKINVAKLANFMEIDVFVLIACPENTLLDSKEFYKPILTPFEIEIACLQERDWDGSYLTDFRQLLPGGKANMDIKEDSHGGNPDYSFITGRMQCLCQKADDDSDVGSQQAVVAKGSMQIVQQHHASAAEFLSHRSWKGLEDNQDDSSTYTGVVEGRRGIALKYEHEDVTAKD